MLGAVHFCSHLLISGSYSSLNIIGAENCVSQSFPSLISWDECASCSSAVIFALDCIMTHLLFMSSGIVVCRAKSDHKGFTTALKNETSSDSTDTTMSISAAKT